MAAYAGYQRYTGVESKFGEVALGMAAQREAEVKKQKDLDKINSNRLKKDLDSVDRAEDVKYRFNEEALNVYNQSLNKVVSLNNDWQSGTISEADYYTSVQKVNNSAAIIEQAYQTVDNKLAKLTAGDKILNASAVGYINKNILSGKYKFTQTEDGNVDIQKPIYDKDTGEVTGYDSESLTNFISGINQYQAVSDVGIPMDKALKLGNDFKQSTVTTGQDGATHMLSGSALEENRIRLAKQFEDMFTDESPLVLKQALMDHPEFEGSPSEIPSEWKQEAKEQLRGVTLNAIGYKRTDRTPKPAGETTTDKKKALYLQDSIDAKKWVTEVKNNVSDALAKIGNFKLSTGETVISAEVTDDNKLRMETEYSTTSKGAKTTKKKYITKDLGDPLTDELLLNMYNKTLPPDRKKVDTQSLRGLDEPTNITDERISTADMETSLGELNDDIQSGWNLSSKNAKTKFSEKTGVKKSMIKELNTGILGTGFEVVLKDDTKFDLTTDKGKADFIKWAKDTKLGFETIKKSKEEDKSDSKYSTEQEDLIAKNLAANPEYSREEIIEALGL